MDDGARVYGEVARPWGGSSAAVAWTRASRREGPTLRQEKG
jgi:hypothetical protein